jgi:hypothetical protein
MSSDVFFVLFFITRTKEAVGGFGGRLSVSETSVQCATPCRFLRTFFALLRDDATAILLDKGERYTLYLIWYFLVARTYEHVCCDRTKKFEKIKFLELKIF